MSKRLKLFIVTCLALCAAVCLGIFAAGCNGDTEDKYFTVCVKLPDDTPVEGVKAQISTENGKTSTSLDAVETDTEGVAKFNLNSPVDVSDTTKFRVRLTPSTLPERYAYSDENGIEYNFANGEGKVFDTKTTGFSATVKLTYVEPEIVLGKAVNAVQGRTYTFTAEEAGRYKISVWPDYNISWSLNGQAKTEQDEIVDLAKNEKAEISVTGSEPYQIYVVNAVGSLSEPVAVTLGSDYGFNVKLVKSKDALTRSEKLKWNTDENSFYVTFITAEAGAYDVSVESNFPMDSLDIILEPVDDTVATPDLVVPVLDDTGRNIIFSSTHQLLADTQYRVTFTANADYDRLACVEGTIIRYTASISKSGGYNDGKTLTVDTPLNAIGGDVYEFTAGTVGKFTVTFTEIEDSESFYWMLNGLGPKYSTTEEIDLTQNQTITIEVNTNCVITVTTSQQ